MTVCLPVPNLSEFKNADACIMVSKVLHGSLCTDLHLPSGADEVIGSHGSLLLLFMMKVVV
jgi:hypothetical protein